MGKHISRFRRKRSEARKANIELTTRDASILLALHKYRFLTTDHLMALTKTQSRWGMNKRLRLLYDHKYIDRPQAQRAIFSHADKRPTVYALGNAGASLLSARFNISMPPKVYWTEKNRRVREQHIEHTLGISDFMIEIEMLCRGNDNLRLIDREEILAGSPVQARNSKYPFRWKTQIRHNAQRHDIAIVPDYVFGIEFADRPEGQNRRYYFVEIDRGTMPITRRDILQSSIIRKVQSYADTYDRKLAERHFAMSGFQVLFITTSPKRIADMQAAIGKVEGVRFPASLFLFGAKAQPQLSLPFLARWTNAGGKARSLF